jgi:hypothetical protein
MPAVETVQVVAAWATPGAPLESRNIAVISRREKDVMAPRRGR